MPEHLERLRPIDIARANWPVNCSQCGASAVRVLERRPNRHAIRRRKQCTECGFRETTYEISQEQFKELQVVAKVRQALLGTGRVEAAEPVGVQCSSCRHWAGVKCDFGFPEAGGAFAGECSMYGA